MYKFDGILRRKNTTDGFDAAVYSSWTFPSKISSQVVKTRVQRGGTGTKRVRATHLFGVYLDLFGLTNTSLNVKVHCLLASVFVLDLLEVFVDHLLVVALAVNGADSRLDSVHSSINVPPMREDLAFYDVHVLSQVLVFAERLPSNRTDDWLIPQQLHLSVTHDQQHV